MTGFSRDVCELADDYELTQLKIPSLDTEFSTAFLRPKGSGLIKEDTPPLCLLHGFDSSSLDYRRLRPLLSERMPVWAVDLVGWGFTDLSSFQADTSLPLGPQQKREHLYQFWKTMIDKPMVLYGASLGGAVAVDFALEHPEAVHSLVVQNAQVLIDGIGLMARLPRIAQSIGVQLLKARGVRKMATEMSYFDQELASDEAIDVARLHVGRPGWLEANVAFIKSGGYALSNRVAKVEQPTLILWGQDDKILDSKFATELESKISNSKLVWLEACGHAAFMEQPSDVAEAVFNFLRI